MQLNQFLSDFGEIVSFNSSQHVFRQGEPDPFLYFVRKGLLKAYYINVDGKEFVKSFITEGNMIASLNSAFKKEVCSFNVMCLENCELLKIDFDVLKKKALTDFEIADAVFQLLITFGMKKEKREYEFLCASAEERFKLIQEENPGLLNRVTQNDIARYLGITPVALSRIRGRIKNSC